jgi:N-acetylmuramoyl-L-alanine amidase
MAAFDLLHSPNQDARPEGARIDMLVLHYTGMKTAEAALARLCDPAAKVSAHYTIDQRGHVFAHVAEQRRAWHAGISFWAGESDINSRSIGIELVNPGHEFGYESFPEAQIAALTMLAQEIIARHGIAPARVLGHSDVAPARKMDPGELFPWQQLAAQGIGLFPPPQGERGQGEGALIANDLPRYGYDPAAPQTAVITAFQRHFRPEKLDGLWDEECGAILAALLAQGVPNL